MTDKVWFIRIVDGVWHSFPSRRWEWLFAWAAVGWSARWLFDPIDNFVTVSGAWDGLAALFHYDWLFAGLMFLAGLARLAALTVNGTFTETVYARYSPLVRSITAAICGIFWLLIWLSSIASGGQGLMTFYAFVVVDLGTAWIVIGEGADVLREWRNGRAGGGH